VGSIVAVQDGEKFISDKGGSVIITAPAKSIVVLQMAGNVGADCVPGQLVLLRRINTGEPTDFFYDLWDMITYDSDLRVELTNFHLSHRSGLRSLHTITQSKLVKMGVTVANVALKLITQHPTRASFESALSGAIAMRKAG
jgi:hypothetical protein